MRFKILCFILLFYNCSQLIAQTNFERSYLQIGMKQYGVSIAELNGKFYVTSLSDDCGLCLSTESLTQFDQLGNILHTNYFSNGTLDEIVGELTPYRNGFVFPVTYDFFTPTTVRKQVDIRYVDSTGFEVWTATISDSLKDFQNTKLVIGNSNVITGFADNLTSTGTFFFQVDSAGNVIRIEDFARIPDVYSVRDLVFKNDHFYVLGVGVVNGATKTFIRKVDSARVVVDSSIYDYATEISGIRIKSFDDGFVICGQSYDTLGHTQVCLMKIDSLGNVVWRKNLTTTHENIPTSLEVFQNGRLNITGKTIDQFNNVELFIISADSTGNLLWKREYCLPGPIGCIASAGNSIIESSDHSIVVCGQVQYSTATPNLYILKADAAGLISSVFPLTPEIDRPFIKKQDDENYYRVMNVSEKFKILIFDITGKLILAESNLTEFNIDFAQGIYLYSIQTSSGIFSGKLF